MQAWEGARGKLGWGVQPTSQNLKDFHDPIYDLTKNSIPYLQSLL